MESKCNCAADDRREKLQQNTQEVEMNRLSLENAQINGLTLEPKRIENVSPGESKFANSI